jgi:hypothetical protein
MGKACSKCKIVKDILEYSRYKTGYKPACKKCYSEEYKLKVVLAGGKNRIDRSIETNNTRVCPKCNSLLSKKLFNLNGYCKSCTRSINRAIANKKGIKEKFIPIIIENEKQCAMCKDVKNLQEYSVSERGRFGKSCYCKNCSSKYQRLRLSKEERCIKTQKYRDNNREWWRSLHRINQFNRRNKIKLVSDVSVTSDFVKSVYNTEICYYCKESTPLKFRTLEHKHPLNKGGLHSSSNITMACLQCNCSKRDMLESEYYEYLKIKKHD